MSKKIDREQYNKTPEECRTFLERVLGRPSRELAGNEYEQAMLMIMLMDPYQISNNQRTITERYKIGKVDYHVTYLGLNEEPIIEVFNE